MGLPYERYTRAFVRNQCSKTLESVAKKLNVKKL